MRVHMQAHIYKNGGDVIIGETRKMEGRGFPCKRPCVTFKDKQMQCLGCLFISGTHMFILKEAVFQTPR